MKYRGPIGVVDAFLFTGKVDRGDAPIWLGEKIQDGSVRLEQGATPTLTLDSTVGGTLVIEQGDYIVRDTSGKLHAVKQTDFAADYTMLEEERT